MAATPFLDGPGSVVFDLDGVVYLGSTPIKGAAETIDSLIETGWQVLFATNNSTKTPHSVADGLRATAGVVIDPTTVLTSGMSAGAYLRESEIGSAFVVGSRELERTVEQFGVSVVDSFSAESVVVGLDHGISYEKIAEAASAIRSGAAFVATNTDSTFPTPNGLAPGAGTIVAAIATASGSEYVDCGKPHEPMRKLVSERLTSPHVWMIGDRPETDIAFAKAAGWKSVLTLTGVTARPSDVPDKFTPDHVLDSVANVTQLLTDDAGSNSDKG